MKDRKSEKPILTNTQSNIKIDQPRRFDIDALRVIAFGLLILYHVGMFYVSDWGYHIKSTYTFDGLQLPMTFVNQWRMPLLFMISGIALSFVVGKYSLARLAARRILRLLLPLVFGMAFIVAPQCYYEALAKGIIEPGFWEFMVSYLTFSDFPGDAWAGEEIIVWTWNHLWYLSYVLVYSLLLLLLIGVFPRAFEIARKQFSQLRGFWLIAIPTGLLTIIGFTVYPKFPYISHALIDDWYAHAMYGFLFLLGFLIGRDSGVWTEFVRLRYFTLLAGIATFVILQYNDMYLVVYSNRWIWLLAAFGWGHHFLNRPMKWLPYATEAVYPWYILHQTITIAIGYNVAKLALGPALEVPIVLFGTIGGCFLIHEFAIRRNKLIRPLFGLAATSAIPQSGGKYLVKE